MCKKLDVFDIQVKATIDVHFTLLERNSVRGKGQQILVPKIVIEK